MTPQIIRTVEELEALDPYDVIAYKSPEGYDLVCTAYDATIGDADYTLPVATVCSHSTTMAALRALNEEHPMTNIDRAAEIIGLAARGAHTADGHPMKMSDHTAHIIAEALADDGALVNDQWEYAAIELCPNGPFHDDPDGYSWSAPRWWHPAEQDALDDLKTEFMQWRYGASVVARIIRRPKPHTPEVARHLYPNPHRQEEEA